MADLSSGARAKIIVEAGEVYRVGSSGVASVRVQVNGGAATRDVTNTAGPVDFGPYPSRAVLQVTATAGGATYTRLSERIETVMFGRVSQVGGNNGLVPEGIPAPWSAVSVMSGKKGLLPEYGAEPLYYRDTIAAGGGQVLTQPMVRDHLGIPRQTAAGQVLTWGHRIEENLIRFSNDLTNGTNWLTANGCTTALEYDYSYPQRTYGHGKSLYSDRPGGYVTRVTGAAQANSLVRVNNGILPTLRAVPHRVSFYAKVPSGSLTFEVRLYVVAGANAVTSTFTLTAADGWQRLCLNLGTPDGTSAYVVGIAPGTFAGTGGGVLLIGGVMLQERLSTETAPSEHIRTDAPPVSARWWYGLGLDRIECFGTTNGNNVAAGAFSASAGGRVIEADGLPLTRYGIRSSPTVQQFARTDVNNWTVTRATVATGVAAPDGTLTAFDIVEDGTGSQSHFAAYTLVGTNTYDNQFMVFSVFAKRRSGSDRQWLFAAFADLTATNKGAFFDLQNGLVGTVSAGLYGSIEDWGNGWYRCIVRGSVGAGANDVQMRLFVANADNAFAPTVSTIGNGVRVWCPNVTGPLSSTGTARAMPTRPALNASANIALIPGSILARDTSGLIGQTEFAALGSYAVYGMLDEPYKSGTGFVYGGALYLTSADPAVRGGISHRPAADGAPGGTASHTLKLAGDVYVGEFNDRFFWRPNTRYELGQIAIPLDTLPGNSNNRKMFTCVQAGTSGSGEPSWDATYVATPDTVTNITNDGTVKWQANTNNGIASNWEEYLGIHLKPTQTGFHQQIKWAWWQSATEYGMVLNGVVGERQTQPQINNGVVPVLPRELRIGWYGKQDGSASLPDAAPAGYNPTAAMGVWDTDHQDLVIYSSVPERSALQAATA